jgi:hypothetical protein
MKVRRTFRTFALVLGVSLGVTVSASATTVDAPVNNAFLYTPMAAPVVQNSGNENTTANQSNVEQQSLVSAFSQTGSVINFMSWSNMVTADLFSRLTATAIVVREPDMAGQGTYTVPAPQTSFAIPAPFAQQTTPYTVPAYVNAPSSFIPTIAPPVVMASSVAAPTYQGWGAYSGINSLYQYGIGMNTNVYAPILNVSSIPAPTNGYSNPYSLGNQLGNLPLGGPVSMPATLHAPEPVSMLLIGSGLAALIFVRRRK